MGRRVVASVIQFLGVASQAGVLRDWFKPVSTLYLLLPGLASPPVGGRRRRYWHQGRQDYPTVIDPSKQMHARLRSTKLRDPPRQQGGDPPALRRPAYVDVQGGMFELDWSYAVIQPRRNARRPKPSAP
jgi:hypothetical protein